MTRNYATLSDPANPAAHLLRAAAGLAPAYWSQRSKATLHFHSGTVLLMLYESLRHGNDPPGQTDAVGLLALAAAGQDMEPTPAKAAINGAVVALHSIISPGAEPDCASESGIAAMRVAYHAGKALQSAAAPRHAKPCWKPPPSPSTSPRSPPYGLDTPT